MTLSRSWLSLAAALLLVDLILVLPTRADPAALLRLPLELPALVLLLALAPGRLRPWLGRAAALGLWLLGLFKLADFGIGLAYGRPFDLVADLGLAWPGWLLARGALGPAGAAAAIGAALLLLAASGAALAAATARLARTPEKDRRRTAGLAAAGLALALLTPAPVAASRYAADQARRIADGLADGARFAAEMAGGTFAEVPDDRLLAGLRGVDVVLVYVESYGRVAVDSPLYRASVLAALQDAGRRLDAAGWQARSAWLASPTFGGESWLAQSSFVSGLTVDSQRRYETLVGSTRTTLVRDFRRAGWRAVTVRPAITIDWPEGRYFGYDAIWPAAALGYAGDRFNWMEIMPDQFSLAAFRRLAVDPADRPLFAEVALVSSHAPWTPVPPLLPDDRLGDGTVYNDTVRGADPDRVVWQDPQRVRVLYGQCVEYSLRTLTDFILAYPRDALFILLGDHQPAPIVSGEGASHDVPIHVVARNPALLARLDGWRWSAGMVPDAASPTWPMAAMRGRLIDTFTPR
jgi:hypothetical protein